MRTLFGRSARATAISLVLAAAMLCAVVLSGASRGEDLPIPNCDGLACYSPEDCGSSCFCNGPNNMCYNDSELE